MKFFKSTFYIFLVALINLILLFSCVDKQPPPENKDNPTTPISDTSAAVSSALDGYKVVRAELSSNDLITAARKLKDEINLAVGANITISDDFVMRGESVPTDTKEILVGATNRAESQELLKGLKADDYIIKKEPSNGRIIVLGGSDASTNAAVDYFIANFINKTSGSLDIPTDGYAYKEHYALDGLKLNGADMSEYYIEYDSASSDSTLAANILRDFLRVKTGTVASIVKMNVKAPKGLTKKITISPNRKLCGEGSIYISRERDIITLGGNDPKGCFYSTAYFIINVISKGGETDLSDNKPISIKIGDIPMLEPINIHVAPNGDDLSGDGSVDKPFATLSRAKDEARNLKVSLAPITVNLRGGEYKMSEPGQELTLSEEDSGTPLSPVTYQAYPGEEVILIGGVKLDSSAAVPASDQNITGRVIDKFAASKLMQIDLSAFLTEAPPKMILGSTGKIPSGTPEVYINGKALGQSRYPNDEAGSAYLRTARTKSLGSDYQNSPFQFFYKDPENHASHWSPEAVKDLYIYGFIGFDWSDGIYKVDSIADELVTTTGGSEWEPQSNMRFYFFNLPEEIDVPGESYLDPNTRILYFYPPCDMKEAEIYLSRQEKPLINLEKTSYITIKNINFSYSRGTAVSGSGVSNITIDGCGIGHTSSDGINLNGTQCAIRNCHIYDTMTGGIRLTGGDRASLVSSGNVIENNRLHDNSRILKCYQPSISCVSIGTVIKNNTIYNSPHQLIETNSNDIIITNNEIYNGVLESSDMGAIYYGRDPSCMGIEIKYNFFHDIGNSYGGIGQQSIFCDDGAAMPYIYGNLFYRGSRTKESGGTDNDSFAIKANGSQFGLVKNNVFVDSPVAALFGSWTRDWNENPRREDRWMLWAWDLYPDQMHNIWQKLTEQVDFFSQQWRDKYKSTQWTPLWEYLNQTDYDKAHAFADSGDTTSLWKFAYSKAPENTNIFENNVGVKINYNNKGQFFKENGTGVNNLRIRDTVLPDGGEIFTDLGKDFTFTPEALAFVKETIPNFEELPLDNMGIHKYDDGTSDLKLPGGSAPEASDAKVSGSPSAGSVLTAEYVYSDPQNIPEGVSEITWHISDNGSDFELIAGKRGAQLPVDTSYSGKFICFVITPYNRNTVSGEKVISETVKIDG